MLLIAAGFLVPGIPLFVSAQGFSLPFLFSSSTPTTTPVVLNSQNMPLLAPAINLDPSPAIGGGDITLADGMALVPEQGPSGTVADIEEWPTSSQVSVYTVHPGDTLSGIAQMFNVNINTIKWANDIPDGIIHPGDKLTILPITGVRHTVVSGETLASVAKKFNSNASDIAQYNGLDPSQPLAAGTSIIIPNGEVASESVSTNTSVTTPKTSSSVKKNSRSKKAPYEPYLGGSGPELAGFFAWPLQGGIITQGLHGWNAVDIGAPKGTDIYAAADGTVIVAKDNGGWNGGYGNYVVVQHDNGTQTLYAHMSKVLVSAGDGVSKGQTIGLVGATGEATGPHLHFEVRGAENPFAALSLGSSDN